MSIFEDSRTNLQTLLKLWHYGYGKIVWYIQYRQNGVICELNAFHYDPDVVCNYLAIKFEYTTYL